MNDVFRDAMARAIDQQYDAMIHGTTTLATETRDRPAPPLTWARIQRLHDALITDRRTILVRDLRPLREVMAPHGWELVKAKGGHGYWLQATSGPCWRIKVYRSTMIPSPRGIIYVIDPDVATASQRVYLNEVVTTVTALALAGVDERVG